MIHDDDDAHFEDFFVFQVLRIFVHLIIFTECRMVQNAVEDEMDCFVPVSKDMKRKTKKSKDNQERRKKEEKGRNSSRWKNEK